MQNVEKEEEDFKSRDALIKVSIYETSDQTAPSETTSRILSSINSSTHIDDLLVTSEGDYVKQNQRQTSQNGPMDRPTEMCVADIHLRVNVHTSSFDRGLAEQNIPSVFTTSPNHLQPSWESKSSDEL